ncbi:hypothetical protein BJ166DRAFT_536175 [Pestalotiopsis sp. NC0098]|nr:hypothetical protein BJ166DRAFT_536175 [Pestalotiopsis sp. NC0098]
MSSDKKDKKSKRDKSEHKSKKRNRDLEAQPEEEHRHKRSKSEAPGAEDDDADVNRQIEAEQAAAADASVQSGKARRSEKRKKKRQSQGGEDDEATAADVSMTDAAATNGEADEQALATADTEASPEKSKKKNKKQQPADEAQDSGDEKKKRKKDKKEKRSKEAAGETSMEVDTPGSHRPFGKLPDQPYPFFTQKVSQYLPLFPLGMIEPVEGYAEQHLKPLLNHYVPTFEGVLLGYHDVQVGEAPGKGSLTENSDNSQEAMLESIDEYAVAFGWLTAKLDLFRPRRGAWMEGSVNMQTEGHLGVVCWGMFNASIEAGRLPKGWRWVSLLQGKNKEAASEEASLPTPEPVEEGQEEEDDSQLHTTGYWVNNDGQRVRGNLKFQIKNFEVGVSGDYGYLSIEGTMLEPEAEQQKAAEEVEKLRRWKLRNGASRKEHKRLPDFSMTKFGMDEEQEDETQRAEVWKGSRPASETAE